MNKKRWTLVGLLVVLVSIWCVAFPSGNFGYARYAFTIFNRWPKPVVDFEVQCDGSARRVAKTHELDFDSVQWLTDGNPEVIIVAVGWDGVVQPDDKIRAMKNVRVLKNKEAIELFKQLKKDGKRVAIHYHSTC